MNPDPMFTHKVHRLKKTQTESKPSVPSRELCNHHVFGPLQPVRGANRFHLLIQTNKQLFALDKRTAENKIIVIRSTRLCLANNP